MRLVIAGALRFIASILISKFRAWLSLHYHALMQIRDTPHAIAGGLAIGLYIGFTPILGKTLLAIFVAWLSRCSKIAAAVSVNFHDVLWLFPPGWLLLLRLEYCVGFWLISHPHRLPAKLPLKHLGRLQMHEWVHFKTLKVLWPTLLGALILALPVAIICYFVTLRIVARYQQKLAAKRPETSS